MENPDAHFSHRDLTVSVRLISPSQDLSGFPDLNNLPVSTTVGQVKALIGNELAARSRSPLGMRVIYRGRVLDVDEKTLEEVFGIPSIQEANIQILHLVLRDGTSTTRPGAPAAQAAPAIPAARTNQRSRTAQNRFAQAAVRDDMRAQAQQILADIEEDMHRPETQQRFQELARQQSERHSLRDADPNTQQQYVEQQRQLHSASPTIARDPTYLVEFLEINPYAPIRHSGYTDAEEAAFDQLDQIHTTQLQAFASRPQNINSEFFEIERRHLLAVQEVEQDQLRDVMNRRRLRRQELQSQPQLHRLPPPLPRGYGQPQPRTQQPQAPLSQQPQVQQQLQLQQQQPPAYAPVQPQVLAAVPGLSPQVYPTQATPALSQRHTSVPQRGNAPPQPRTSAMATGASVGHQTAGRPNVYVLESPSGPRAVLINSNAEAYYTPAIQAAQATQATQATQAIPGTQATPAVPATRNVPVPQQPAPAEGQNEQLYNLIQQHNVQIQQQQQQYQFLIQQNLQHVELLHRLQQQHAQQFGSNIPTDQAAQQVQAAPQAAVPAQQDQAPNVAANLHNGPGLQPNNPGAGFLAAMWPHIWLFARLVLFIWWFTAPTASWTRWATVILVAIAVFVFNTGMLDEVANQAWAPVRAHLDGLVPMPNANGAAGQQEGQGNQNGQEPAVPAANGAGDAAVADAPGRAGGAEPDPAATAARLVAERRRDNGRRLNDFARRLERLGIMFLASLAPGIAERHVALAEEREREERRRLQEAAEAAVAVAAEAQAQAEAAAAAEVDKENEGSIGSTGPGQANAGNDDTAAVDAQWRSEQQVQNERDAAHQTAAVPVAMN